MACILQSRISDGIFFILSSWGKNVQWEYPILFLACWDSLSICVGVYIKENEQMLGHRDFLPTRQAYAPRSSFCNKANLISKCFLSFVSPTDRIGRKSGMCTLPLKQTVCEEFFEVFILHSWTTFKDTFYHNMSSSSSECMCLCVRLS